MNGMVTTAQRVFREAPGDAAVAQRRENSRVWLASQLVTAVKLFDDRHLPFTGRPQSTVSEVIADNIAGPIREALFEACHYAMQGNERSAAAALRKVVQLSGEDYALCHADELGGDA